MNTPKKVMVHDVGILKGMDATAIAEGIRNKDFTVKEAVDCVRQRAEKADPTINSIVASDYEMNLDNYKKDGFFAGVPMYIKDLVHIKGFPTLLGSMGMPHIIDKKSEKSADHFMSAGFVNLGKSSTSEFGLLPSTETLRHGNTLNPVNTEYSTGGSSGGAGALVASGIVPMAHAMDGGGSIRIPASCCGLVGLKPSRGRIAGSPTAPLPIDIVTYGVVSKTVRDTANFFHSVEPYHSPKKLQNIGQVTGPNSKRLKIAMFTSSPAGIEADPDVADAVRKAGKLCEDLGHQVDYIPNPYSDVVLFDFLIYYSFLGWLSTSLGRFANHWKFKASKTESFTKGLDRYYPGFISLSPKAFSRLRNQVVKEYNASFEKYDVVLNPVLQGPTPKLGVYGPEVGFISLVMRLNNYINYTIIQNTSGAPAISLPMGQCKNDVPIGVQFGAKLGDEKTLLELSFELEQAGGFIDFSKNKM